MRRWIGIILLVLSMTVWSACTAAPSDVNGKVKVTATIGMITDIVREVGGERVAVTGLMPAGVDPHLYKASQGDIRRLEDADIIFYNGLFLEGKMAEILALMSKEKPTYAVTDNIPRDRLLQGDPELEEEFDPHVWFDVSLWMMAVEKVRDELMQFDSEHEEVYRANADRYLERLEELHAYAKEQIARIPEQSRVLVTAHDAFGYFGEAYQIEVIGLQGLSTASEAGSKDVTDLRDLLVDRNIKAVFVESSVPKTYIEAVIEGARQKGHEVVIGGELYSDAMGEEGTPEGTYVGMVEHNIKTIVEALQ